MLATKLVIRQPHGGLRSISGNPDFCHSGSNKSSASLNEESSKMKETERKYVLILSLPLFVLILTSSLVGLIFSKIYDHSTPNWLVQTIGQDAIDLFIVLPVLMTSALYSFKKNRIAWGVWGGTLAYLAYTFVIYSFAVIFNSLFLIYCMVLGLASYALAFFAYIQMQSIGSDRRSDKVTGWYFVVVSVCFAILWLSEIVPATISGTLPASLIKAGLSVNPIHVLDLAFFLPMVFITGIAILRNRRWPHLVTPSLLVFFILMDITIGVLSLAMRKNDVGGSIQVAIAMGVLALISLVLFVRENRPHPGNNPA